MNNVDTCFVVLHYLTYENTYNCVCSLLDIDKACSSKIVIVDNNSANGSYEQLCDEFEDNPRVFLIHNSKNEGFARGMNIGYTFSRDILKAKTIGILNNDLFIKQKDFLNTLGKIVANGVDVIGPDIVIESTGVHANPQRVPNNYKAELLKYKILYAFYSIIHSKTIYKLIHTLTNREDGENNKWNQSRKNVQLQGAAIFFSNSFVKNESICLDPRTFLYQEEDLLFQYCRRRGYAIEYTPALQVIHAGGSSTSAQIDDMRKRKLYRLQQQIQSIHFVIDTINRYGRYDPE